MKFILFSTTCAALLATASAVGRLGKPQRELQSPSTVVLNSLIETFLPAVVDELENNIAQDLDPVALEFNTAESVDGTLSVNDTTTCASLQGSTNATGDDAVTAVSRSSGFDTSYTGEITYYIGEMSGMATMDVQSVELVDGTQDINIPPLAFFGATGATWAGVWNAVANFDQFALATTATLNMTSVCNSSSYTENATGTFTILNPQVTMTIYVQGETDNIYQFNDESVVSVATVQAISMTYTNITGDLGYFDDYVVINADKPFEDKIEVEFAADSDFFQLLIGFVQEEVDKEIPFSL